MYESTLYYGREGAAIQAMAGVDLALWDIKGRLSGQPVYMLLGGAYRKSVRAYASHMFDFDPEATGRRAAEAAKAGFTAVKFGWEPMGPDPELDETLVRVIRNNVGESVDVCIDAGLAWDATTAIKRCRLFEPYGIYWLEEPLHPDDVRGYRKLVSAVSTPIAAGENESTVGRLPAPHGRGGGRHRPGRRHPRRPHPGDAASRRLAHQRGFVARTTTSPRTSTSRPRCTSSARFPTLSCSSTAWSPVCCGRRLTRNPIEVVDGYASVPKAPGSASRWTSRPSPPSSSTPRPDASLANCHTTKGGT